MHRDYVSNLLKMLRGVREQGEVNSDIVRNIQRRIMGVRELSGHDALDEVIRELAYDLDFFEPDPNKRAEDPAFCDSARALEEICKAVERIEEIVRTIDHQETPDRPVS